MAGKRHVKRVLPKRWSSDLGISLDEYDRFMVWYGRLRIGCVPEGPDWDCYRETVRSAIDGQGGNAAGAAGGASCGL